LPIILILLFSCSSYKITKVETSTYDNPCYKFTIPDGEWSQIYDPYTLKITIHHKCQNNPLMLIRSDGQELYFITLKYLNASFGFFKSANETNMFDLYKEVIERTKSEYENYEYKLEDFNHKSSYCVKSYIVIKGVEVGKWKKALKNFNLEDSYEYLRQIVAVYCTNPNHKGFLRVMECDRISVDLNPDLNFEQFATDFFKNVEYLY